MAVVVARGALLLAGCAIRTRADGERPRRASTAASSAAEHAPDMRAQVDQLRRPRHRRRAHPARACDAVAALGHPEGGGRAGESLRRGRRGASCSRRPGLTAPEAELRPLGVFAYLRGKDLALFVWTPPVMPDPAALVCTSCFAWKRPRCCRNSTASACSRATRRCAGSARTWRACSPRSRSRDAMRRFEMNRRSC